MLDDGPFEIPGTSLALAAMQLLAHTFREVGRPIVHIVRMYQPDGANVDPCEQGVTTLVFCGCNYPNCPRTSIYEASERDFRIVLAQNAISGLYERGERELAGIGVHLMSASEIAEALLAATRDAIPTGPGERTETGR